MFDFGRVVPPELPPVHGALSLASLEHVPFTLDLARGEMTFETEGSLLARTAAARRATIRLSRDGAGAGLDVMVSVGASPAPIWLELDSGNIVGTILSPAGAEGIQLEAGRVRAGEPEPVSAELDLLGVGRVPVSARIVPLIYDGVLGVDVMERSCSRSILRTAQCGPLRSSRRTARHEGHRPGPKNHRRAGS